MTGNSLFWSAPLFIAVALPLSSPSTAFGLATEHFGNEPVSAGMFSPALLPLLNDRLRVYWYEVNGDACFYYRGDTPAANEMLRRFAAGGKGREVILHPGPLEFAGFAKARRVTADWQIHVPGGISLSHHPDGGLVTDKGPALHLYLTRGRPAPVAAADQVASWIADLDSDTFTVREQATRALEKQGQAAEPALRRALAGQKSVELRRRIEALLEKLPGVNLALLEIPEGVTVLGPDDLLARCRKGLQSKDEVIRGVAATQIAELEPEAKTAVEGLIRVLKEDKNEYVRRCVAGALGRQGKRAEAALPLLREGLSDPDVNVRNAFQAAIDTIEKAADEPAQVGKARLNKAQQGDIRSFVQRQQGKVKE